eukprot:TRINITY_DN815_c0_g1_i1.p1 TRINITY_DN815_c0_g1~~TRINITY_DN815_c0_g1_i1.p1  ORF type:complete len:481 (+),score=131.94 TRINITY_DN815_c0_g1_i1:144-1586(+)
MGPILPKPVTTKVLERKSTPLFHVGLGCMNGYREKMEDAHSILPRDADNWGFYGVFDGHCGPNCSQYVAKRFEEVIANRTIPISDEDMQAMSLAIDKEFLERGVEGGSTGTFMVVQKKGATYHLQVCNVGDSRIVLGRRKERRCVSLTEDHKPANDEERKRIELAGGHVNSNRVDGSLAVSRAFGDATYKTGDQFNSKVIAVPEFTHCDAEEGDFVLLCCDGVFESDVFSNEGVIEYVFEKLDKKMDLASIAAAVCDEAMERGSKDNISAMIVQLGGELDCGATLPEHEVRAGAYDAADNMKFRNAYSGMAEAAGLTDASCVELRFDQVTAALKKRIHETKCEKKSCDFTTLDLTELRKLVDAHRTGDGPLETKEQHIDALTQVLQQGGPQDLRPTDVQKMEAELERFNVPEDIANMAAGNERTEWFGQWIEGEKNRDVDGMDKAQELAQKIGLPLNSIKLQQFMQLIERGNGQGGGDRS